MQIATRTPPSLLRNVYLSLDLVFDALLTASSIPCHKHGMRQFIPPSSGVWVRARYDRLIERRQWYRQVGPALVGSEIVGTVDITIFEHARLWGSRYTAATARDLVLALFPESELLAVFNFDEELPTPVGVLFIDTISEQVLDLGERSGVVAYSLQVGVRFLEQFTVSTL